MPTQRRLLPLAVALVLGIACHVDSLFTTHGQNTTGFGLSALYQLQADSATTIPSGGSANGSSVVMSAVLEDSDATATLQLVIEVQPVGTPFSGHPTSQSDAVSSGARAYAVASGLANGTSYHWQARVADQKGDSSAWQAFGGTGQPIVDFRIAVATTTTRLVFRQQPATTTAGATMTPVEVDLVDAQGNTITTFTGTVTLDFAPVSNGGGASLSGTTSVNAVAGAATFSDLKITVAATGYRLEATSDTLQVASTAFAINPGAPDHLSFLNQPTNTSVNQAITPPVRVAVQDIYNNVASSYTDVLYMNIAHDPSLLGAHLDPAGTQRAASAGIATFEDLKIDQIGTGYTLGVSATGTRGTTSDPFNVGL